MLMKDDKKKMASIIVGKMDKPDEEMEPKEGAIPDDSVALESAAEELLQAVESKSPKAVVEAMKSLMDLMDQDEPSMEELSAE